MTLAILSTAARNFPITMSFTTMFHDDRPSEIRKEYPSAKFRSLPDRFNLLFSDPLGGLYGNDVACHDQPRRNRRQTYNTVPCVGWGKYVREGEKFQMSMHMKISHAFVDGKPLADAFNNIQSAVKSLDFGGSSGLPPRTLVK